MRKARTSPDGEEVRIVIRQLAHTYDGQALSVPDLHYVAECIVMRRELLKDLLPDPLVAKSYWRAIRSLDVIDAKSMFSCFKECRKILLSEEFRTEYVTGDTRRIKLFVDSSALKAFVTPVLRILAYPGFSPEQRFAKANQWLSFDRKLNLRSLDYSEVNAYEYLDHEFVIQHEPVDADLHRRLNIIIREWFADFTPEIYPPKLRYSSGATAELSRRQATAHAKAAITTFPFSAKKYLAVRGNVLQIEAFVPPQGCRFVTVAHAQVRFVPKNPLTNRVVSMEPAGLQLLQQDFYRIVRDYLEPVVPMIRLRNQRISRELAIKGSVAGSYTTVDLRSGSDNIRVTAVKAAFAETTVAPLLESIRSKKSDVSFLVKRPGKEDVREAITTELEVFAPMGSGQCFITMSVYLAACCDLAVRVTDGRRGQPGDYQVYGDDCVIRTRYYNAFRLILALARIRVNDDKSFSDAAPLCYREACGVEALNGLDITPFMLSRRFTGVYSVVSSVKYERIVNRHVPDPGRTVALVDMVNRLLVHGLVNVRRWILQRLSNQAWWYSLYRIRYSEFRYNADRWDKGLPTVYDITSPTVVTPDVSDVNWRISESKKPRILVTRTVSRDTSFDETDYWINQCCLAKGTNEGAIDHKGYASQLVYNGSEPLTWRLRTTPLC